MDHAQWRSRLLELPDSTESRPFGPGVLVYKTAGRMFALLSEDREPPRLSLKCEPGRALQLRDAFAAVIPGYHLNKEHWNTIDLDGSLPDELLDDLVEHSWERIVAGLSRKEQARLQLLKGGTA